MFTILQYLWRGFLAHVIARPSLALLGTAAVALSLASFERTFHGMQHFTQKGWVVSALVTFGVQAMMLVVAWRLGDAHASPGASLFASSRGRQPVFIVRWLVGVGRWLRRNFFVRNALLILSFLACAAICVFFSFDAFYYDLTSANYRAKASKDAALEVVHKISVDLGPKLDEERRIIAANLKGGADWQVYQKDLNSVIDAATDPSLVAEEQERDRLRSNARAAEQESQRRAAQDDENRKNRAKSVYDQLLAEKQGLEAQLETLKGERAVAEEKLKVERAKTAAIQSDLDDVRRRMAREEHAGNGVRRAGRGTEWNKLKEIEKARENELPTPQARERQHQAEIAANESKRQPLQTKLDETKLRSEIARTEWEGIRVQAIQPSQSGTDSANAVTIKSLEEAEKLRPMPAIFLAAPTNDGLSAIEKQCGLVIGAIKEIPGGQQRAEALKCSPPSGTRGLLEKLLAFDQRQRNFESQCSNVVIADLSFDDLIKHGQVCMQAAKIVDNNLDALLGRVSLEQDRDAPSFTKTMASFARGDKLAYLAVAMAIALDGLVLMAGMWGARTSASHLSRNRDETAGETDSHAELMMMMETRPVARARDDGPEPAEAYKARLFVRHVRPRYDPDNPELAGTISFANLDEIERDAIRSVLTIGPFAWPIDGNADSDTWLVSRRLLRYVTHVAANHDRFERFHRTERPVRVAVAVQPVSAELPLEAPTAATYWTRAAAEANRADGGTTGDNSSLSEDELINVGFGAHVEAVKTASNDNPEELVSPAKPAPVESPARAASA